MHRSFFLLFVSTAWIQAATINLENVPSFAIGHNPQLKAAALRIDEARGRLLGAGRLQNPELEIGFSQNVRRPERSFEVGFMQRFPVTARLQLEKRITKEQLLAAEAEVRDARRRVGAESRAGAIKYVALNAQKTLRQQQLANSREQTEFLQKRVGTGEASVVDVSQVELEAEQLRVEIVQLETQQVVLSGELRVLMGIPGSEDVNISGSLASPDKVPAKGAGNIQRPDLDASHHLANAARESVALAKARKWEDVGAGIATSAERTEDAPDGFSNDYFLGFRVSIPLPVWNQNQGAIQEASAAATRAEKETSALAFTIRAEAEAARGEMEVLAKLIREMDQALLPKASSLEEQLRNAYATGQTPLTEALRARARRLELAQRRIDVLRDFHLARARWEAALGSPRSKGGEGK